MPTKIQPRKCASTKGTGMSLPLLGANGRMLVVEETLQNVEPLPARIHSPASVWHQIRKTTTRRYPAEVCFDLNRKFDNDAVTWRQYSESRAQMNDHETIHLIGQSQAEPRTRVRAQAKITVQSSEAKPYDQTASPASMEIRGRAIFPGCAARAALKASLEKGEFRLSQNVQFFASTTGFFSTPSFSISTSTSSPAFK